MHTIKELKDILGYSSDQLRLRLDKFRPILNESVRRGDNNKILLDDNGLEILRRAKDLEKQNIPLNDIPNRLEKEINQNGNNASDNLAQTDQSLIEEKEKRIQELKERINELHEDKQYLKTQVNELQQKLITGEVEKKEKGNGPIKRFFEWLW